MCQNGHHLTGDLKLCQITSLFSASTSKARDVSNMLFNIVFVWLVVSVVADYRGWKPEEWGQYWVSPNPVRCRDDGAPFMALRTTICPEGRTRK
ncbi:hypothetical protein L596_010530 [Steinernema carpocapsae]|uniref:Uncharacterized protein n=1 Tax=Steinernema carpocapsae TaxID=34508 RepID=A0A4U5PIK2_STECR|nr:hypothetical protein L596_010530 [Steinernema carpocapsae]